MALSDLPAERHREVAGLFTDRVRGTTEWEAPAPVDGWVARDVVRHLLTWLPDLLSRAGVGDLAEADVPDVDTDPVGAWVAHAHAVQALLDEPTRAGQTVSEEHMGEMTLAELVDRIYTTDVFLHTWDLARATGQDDRLDADHCAQLLAGMEPMEEAIRASGHYGSRVPVPSDADAQTRLLAFIGRDPALTGPGEPVRW